jgi:hypothetical protein
LEQKVLSRKLRQQVGKLAGGVRVGSIVAAIGKDVHFLGMCMQVQKHLHSTVVEKDVALDGIDLLAEIVTRTLPAAVQVVSRQIATRIACNDPVRISHWDDLNDILLKEPIQQMRAMLFFG